jgi:hypothetical protein
MLPRVGVVVLVLLALRIDAAPKPKASVGKVGKRFWK